MGTVIEFITSRMMCISTPASSYDESTMSRRKNKSVIDKKNPFYLSITCFRILQ